ncbi:MAG: acyl-CoA synthetase, partial [Bacteroidetes bacterium]|nr:acyl-CoA synthetase [Bacteroidota bacterium]
KVVLLLEGAPLSADIEQRLFKGLSQLLPKYWAPREILYSAKFVESKNGKIRRKESWQNIQ